MNSKWAGFEYFVQAVGAAKASFQAISEFWTRLAKMRAGLRAGSPLASPRTVGSLLRALSLDTHGPSFRVDCRPDPQVEIELKLARLFVGRKRVTKPGFEPPLTHKLHIETKTPQEVGQVMRLPAVADLDPDTAKMILEPPQSGTSPLSKSVQAAKIVKAGPS
jgi:hypothetical protein